MIRRRLGALAATALCTALLSACGAVAPGSTSGADPSLGTLPTGTLAAHQTTLAPGSFQEKVVVDRRVREFILYVPPNPAVANRPLILVFHGADDTAVSTVNETDFETVAAKDGEVVAFLQGYDDSWNENAGDSPAERAKVNDVAFTAAAIVTIEHLVAFDHNLVVAAGFSNGALMVEDLGCKLASRLALIVPVEGELPVSVAKTCKVTSPISVLEIHGTADTAIPYDGGTFVGVAGGTTVLSAPKSVKRWAALDKCETTPTTTYPSASIKLTEYAKCHKKVTVTLRTIDGGVHEWGANIGLLVAAAIAALPTST